MLLACMLPKRAFTRHRGSPKVARLHFELQQQHQLRNHLAALLQPATYTRLDDSLILEKSTKCHRARALPRSPLLRRRVPRQSR
jgi:hypothetical protein